MSETLQDKNYKEYLPYDPGFCVTGCQVCFGLGWVRVEFGKLQPCPRKEFMWNNKVGLSASEADFYMNMDFIVTENAQTIYDELINLEHRSKGWLYVHGIAGTGKTTSISRWFVDWVRAGGDGTITNHLTMIDYVRASYDENNGQKEYNRRLNEFKTAKLLIIDEIGRDRQTDFAKQVLSDVLDSRYKGAISASKITVLISNFLPEDCLDDYQVDRVRDARFKVLTMKPISLRPALEWSDGGGV